MTSNEQRIETIFIPHLSESMNDFLNRKRSGFGSKKQIKDAIKNFAEIAFAEIKPFEKPIEIEWTPVIAKAKNHKRKKRSYDVLNYSHQYKYTEDTLTVLKKIVDDSNRFVKRHILNTPIEIEGNQIKGIIVVIREVEEDDIKDLENIKKEYYKNAKGTSKKQIDIDKDFAINYFKD